MDEAAWISDIPQWRLIGPPRYNAPGACDRASRDIPSTTSEISEPPQWRAISVYIRIAINWATVSHHSRTSYDISQPFDWSRWSFRPIRSLRYIVTCTRIRGPILYFSGWRGWSYSSNLRAVIPDEIKRASFNALTDSWISEHCLRGLRIFHPMAQLCPAQPVMTTEQWLR